VDGFHTITLGCKLNQFDSAALEGELSRRGLCHQPDLTLASVVIVNTCTVTARADADARKLIRRVRRSNPDCRLLVTGCYAERNADELRSIGGVDRVFGNADKSRVATILDELDLRGGDGAGSPPGRAVPAGDPRPAGDRGCDAALEMPPALHFGDRSRAFLKVQEGCRLACSYCIIPAVRGPSRSVRPEDVLAAARSLLEAGYREIVLTGVNVGDYGRDLAPRTSLAQLLLRLLDDCGPNRFRLNSLEPRTVTDEIVALMAGDPRLAPHLQVPLQSGSAPILRAMRRNYDPDEYLARLHGLRAAVPDVGLGADVIVGFPGETDLRFRETYEFVERSPLSYLHVFSWSARPGTHAAALPGRVPPRAIGERSAALRALAERQGYRFRKRFEGRVLDAVVLGERRADGRTRALTGNFIEVALDEGDLPRGDLRAARILRATPGETAAVVVGRPEWAPHEASRPWTSATSRR
jgi:threonylcarbamoyladenosine tRNA methylthiotransferase MtaB